MGHHGLARHVSRRQRVGLLEGPLPRGAETTPRHRLAPSFQQDDVGGGHAAPGPVAAGDPRAVVTALRTVTQSAREVPVIAETDVLVVGSGPGGLAAALASARAGVATMLVERFGCLGGNITVVGVESIAWYRREGTI